jgi:hypothetical protein
MSDERRARAEAQVEKLRAHFPGAWLGGFQREMLTRRFVEVEREAEARVIERLELRKLVRIWEGQFGARASAVFRVRMRDLAAKLREEGRNDE